MVKLRIIGCDTKNGAALTINFRKKQLFELEKKESKKLKSFQKLLEVISKSQQSQASSSKKNVYIYQT